jgi:hypothetical protein
MKQTAVDWYEKEINSLFEKYAAKQISLADFLIMKHNLFYPAKEIEKEQIKQAYLDSSRETCLTYGDNPPHDDPKFAELYYKNTYEQDENI